MKSCFRSVRVLLLAGAAACASAPPAPPSLQPDDYPGTIRAASVLGDDVLWQQHVTASWGDEGRQGFDAALQKRGGQLTLVGLSPMGSPGFVVQLDGEQISMRNPTDRALPFPPRFLLLDVQRVFFPWLGSATETRADGEYAGVVADERITERVAGGRVVERSFTRLDGHPQGEITVRLEWDHADWRGPSRAVLENRWFGYRLDIDTLAETRLAGTDGTAGAPGS